MTEIGHPAHARLSCLSAVSCSVSVSVTSMPLWLYAKAEKMTEGEAETDTKQFNYFIRLDIFV